MATEIERKFLVIGEAWRGRAGPGVHYRQGYLATTEKCSVRVRVGADEAWLNIKSAVSGRARAEFEYAIAPQDAGQMLETLAEACVVEKVRYVVSHEGHDWEIDVFGGDNEGLVVAEIELDTEDETFARPAWLGEEVTEERRYYNAALARHPYKWW